MLTDDTLRDQRDNSKSDTLGNLQAALARTATRSIALYFSRPVRLFRPSKVSGWQAMRGLALKDGASLNPHFIQSLVKNHGFMVIPKHFIPPMAVNAVLGTVLWTTYGETSAALEPYIGHHPTLTAALSGAVAGGAQALVAAPAENVRLLLEGGTAYHSWSHAWKEVFRGTQPAPNATNAQNLEEIRQVRSWMRDVGEMAGRGWDGMLYGLGKDMTGFAVFFSIFEVTRRTALVVKDYTSSVVNTRPDIESSSDTRRDTDRFMQHLPRTFHGITLVTGGVVAGLAYEFMGRPWDVARRTVELHRLSSSNSSPDKKPTWKIILHRFREDGLAHFFLNPSGGEQVNVPRRRLYAALRTLGRVGPWGVGFLVWEMYSS